jgi:hypothetical protein
MSKKLIYKVIDAAPIDWHKCGFYISISKIEEDIKKLKALGITHIDSQLYEEYGDLSIVFNTYICREETDEDIKLEKQKLITRKNRQIRLLEEELNKLKQL